jgi:hypothetical protein
MKQLLLTGILVSVITALSSAATVYSGAEGYIAMPRAKAARDGRLCAGLKYSYPSLFTAALNFVPLPGLELGFGLDIGNNLVHPPLISVKYQLFSLGFGMLAEFASAEGQSDYYTFYFAWQEDIIGFNTTIGVGYTLFNPGIVRFFMGFQKEIFPKVHLICDFANFPYRFNETPDFPSSVIAQNGIVNLGLRFIVTPFLSFDIAGNDLMDPERYFSVTVTGYFNLWQNLKIQPILPNITNKSG